MFKVEIKKDNVVTNLASFDTVLEAQAWIDQEVMNNSWGLPERSIIINEELLDEQGEVLSPAVIDVLPAEYIVEIIDISEEVAQQKINEDALAYLNSTDWYVIRAQEDPTKPVPEDIKLLRQQAREQINRN